MFFPIPRRKKGGGKKIINRIKHANVLSCCYYNWVALYQIPSRLQIQYIIKVNFLIKFPDVMT